MSEHVTSSFLSAIPSTVFKMPYSPAIDGLMSRVERSGYNSGTYGHNWDVYVSWVKGERVCALYGARMVSSYRLSPELDKEVIEFVDERKDLIEQDAEGLFNQVAELVYDRLNG